LRRLTPEGRRGLSIVSRAAAIVCAIASAILAVYCAALAYAAATFQHDSLPGPVVLSMVAVGAGLAALLCGGLARVLWRAGRRLLAPEQAAGADASRQPGI
jgi:TRAP-type C4-dicarboxylate transport system permease small subunit